MVWLPLRGAAANNYAKLCLLNIVQRHSVSGFRPDGRLFNIKMDLSRGFCSETSKPTRKSNILTPTTIYTRSPASYGVQTFDGYLELIARGAPLPIERTERMESVLDHIRKVSFGIAGRQSILHSTVELGDDVVLDHVRLCRKGEAKFTVTMVLGQDLMGTVSVHDTWTKASATSRFDGSILWS